MIILLLILAIILTVVFGVISIKKKGESVIAFVVFSLSIGAMITLIIAAISFTDNVVSVRYIDKKIEMYQEENAKIEEQINTLVQNYMKYETETFLEFKSENSMALVSLYPELKSDELVQQQISVYTENNKKIKELKEQKIDKEKSKWLLYFDIKVGIRTTE